MVARTRWWLLPLVLAFAACAADTATSDPVSDRDLLVSDISAEINAHYGAIDRAPTMDAARAELARHEAAMDDLERQLGDATPRFRCVRETTGLETSLEERVTSYFDQAAEAQTVADLRRLCLAYANDAHEIFKLMDDRCLPAQ